MPTPRETARLLSSGERTPLWGRGLPASERPRPRRCPGPFNAPPPASTSACGVTSPGGRPMETRLTGRRRWQLLPRGSELEPERWPGAGTRGSLRRHLRVGSSRGRSRSGGRSRGRSEEGACELPRVAGAGTPPTRGGSSSGGQSPVALPRRDPRPRRRGWGLPGRRTGSSQAEASDPASGFSSVLHFPPTKVGGRRTGSTPPRTFACLPD